MGCVVIISAPKGVQGIANSRTGFSLERDMGVLERIRLGSLGHSTHNMSGGGDEAMVWYMCGAKLEPRLGMCTRIYKIQGHECRQRPGREVGSLK